MDWTSTSLRSIGFREENFQRDGPVFPGLGCFEISVIGIQNFPTFCHHSLAHRGRPDVMALKRKRLANKQDDGPDKRHKVTHAVAKKFNASSNRSPSESRI